MPTPQKIKRRAEHSNEVPPITSCIADANEKLIVGESRLRIKMQDELAGADEQAG